eukprot:TRINITY_DN11310_c0_g1_i1.p1 TRINITY_DN11310_c0_g1~~TRINITY_DN11310_c0_g1_i1.p1  ORF type:complete len:167 (+),score=41.22 TRINITY_DN11310_c0_g1_i1:49-501(+)
MDVKKTCALLACLAGFYYTTLMRETKQNEGCVRPVFWEGNTNGCEGYWGNGREPVKGEPWCGKDEFVAKLKAKEDECDTADKEHQGSSHWCKIERQRGLATSRIDDTVLGNHEYHDIKTEVCWTGDFRAHYVGLHNVVPSRAFHSYVMES